MLVNNEIISFGKNLCLCSRPRLNDYNWRISQLDLIYKVKVIDAIELMRLKRRS